MVFEVLYYAGMGLTALVGIAMVWFLIWITFGK